jgi:hypothetical protein
MTTRELRHEEWGRFFHTFSRHYRGQRVTIRTVGATSGSVQTLARRMPLVGITMERENDTVTALEIIIGDSPDDHLMHIIRAPSRIRVTQVANGADELLLIDSDSGQTTTVDVSPPELNTGSVSESSVATAPDVF